MGIPDYWNALGPRQRVGLSLGTAVIVLATVAFGVWVLRDPLVPLVGGLSPERQAAVARELERDKIAYRVADDGNTLLVPSSAAGKARAALGNGGLGLPPSAGLEIFKEADFSTTDFAQRINYQRALQGELTRTLQTIAGVRSARVHVILAEAGLLKRNNTKASVAVTLQLQPGKTLTRAQVNGIQRLVAASVPEVQAGDVVVLDESGNTLSRSSADAEGEASGSQLDLKRQADAYLEAKLSKLLADLAPQAQVTLSADTTLDFKQLKVTTEEPIAASGQTGDHPTGVVTKERQSQRPAREGAQAKGDDGEAADWEYEYQVGRRVEQSMSAPGAIKRVNVAVAIHGAPDGVTSAMVEKLVEHAAGLDRTRGDSVAVVLLPALASTAAPIRPSAKPDAPQDLAQPTGSTEIHGSDHAEAKEGSRLMDWPVLLVLGALALGSTWLARKRQASTTVAANAPVDIDATTAQVRAWLRGDGPAR